MTQFSGPAYIIQSPPRNPLPSLPIHAKLNPINDIHIYQSHHKKGFYNGSAKNTV